MNGFEKRTQQKRERIIQSTLPLLQTTDPQKLRIADIAKKARVSQVTIYNYFGSKEVLVREVYKDYMLTALKEFEDYLTAERSLKEKIKHILLQKKASNKSFGIQVMKQIWQDDPEMLRFFEEVYLNKGTALLVRLIEDGKKKGEISASLSNSTIIFYVDMWTNQVEKMMEYASKHENLEQFIEEMVRLFLYGIGQSEQRW